MAIDVSIIMPSYNVVDYIDTAVRSVINQTITNIEIICIDAGSTDGTVEHLKKLKEEDNRIIFIDSYEKSYGKQVNRGIQVASGKYFSIVETDDYIASNMIEKLLAYAEKYNCDYVKGDYRAFWTQNNGKKVFLDRKVVTNPEIYYHLVRPLDYISLATSDWYLWTGIYKKEFIAQNNICFSETPGAAFQDIGFLHKTYVKAQRAYYLNEAFYFYCIDRVDSSSNMGKGIDFSFYEYQSLFDSKWTDCEEVALYCRMACFFSGCINGISTIDLESKEVNEKFNWFLEKMNYAIKNSIINEQNLYKSIWDAIHPLPINMKGAYENQIAKNEGIVDSLGNSNDINVYIFGCGTYGYYAYKWLVYHKYKVCGYFDNNKDLWGNIINDVPVFELDKLLELKDIDKIVIANEKYCDDIHKQLLNANIDDNNIIVFK